MKKQWYEKRKEDAVKMRKQGYSIRKIGAQLEIPTSTLSGWLKNIELSKEHKERLLNDQKKGLEKARQKAILSHNKAKKERMNMAKSEAEKILEGIDLRDPHIINLAMAMLYLAEGFKTTVGIGIGNSDPAILKFFITALKKQGIPIEKMKCELHLRADQSAKEIKEYWAQTLKIPLQNFTTVSFDKRTLGSVTKIEYKGVCVLRCSNAAIQRKLIFLAKMFLEKTIAMHD